MSDETTPACGATTEVGGRSGHRVGVRCILGAGHVAPHESADGVLWRSEGGYATVPIALRDGAFLRGLEAQMADAERARNEDHCRRVYGQGGVDFVKALRELKDQPAQTEAVKADNGKPACDLLPPAALLAVAEVLSHGAAKYGRHNWRSAGGLTWSRLTAALLRHLLAWQRGEDRDGDSGLPHLAHVACCALMLCEYQVAGGGVDDRWRAEAGR